MAGKKRRQKEKANTPRVAPGFDDERFGEDATWEEIRRGESTKVIRVFLDENDPS